MDQRQSFCKGSRGHRAYSQGGGSSLRDVPSHVCQLPRMLFVLKLQQFVGCK
jgi:hypothetical protein